MKLILAAVALCVGLAAIIVAGVVGFTPKQTPGPFAVRSETTRLEVSGRSGLDGSTGVAQIDVGLWLPDMEAAPRSMPLVIYAPAWGAAYDDNIALVRSIASHGYGVIALSDIALGSRPPWFSADDEAARLARFDISTTERQEQFVVDADRRVALAATRLSKVLDAIGKAQSSDARLGLFNLDVIGAVGASFGGASVSEAALSDGRIGIAVNLDGLVFGRASREVIRRPYVEFSSTLGVVPIGDAGSGDPVRRFLAQTNVQQITRQERQRRERVDAFDVTVRGTRHTDFTDELYGWHRLLSWRPWRERPLRPARVRYIIDTLVVAALDEWVGTKYGRFTRLDRGAYPEVDFLGGAR